MFLVVFLVGLNIIKLWLARFIPLLGDEAYYNIWSRKPALSYVDHPPMVAWLHGKANWLFGQSEFGVRIMAIALILVATWLIYQIAKECYGKKTATYAAVIFNLIPTFLAGGLFLTPETPLMICWLIGLYAMVKIIKNHQPAYWYLFGLAVGFGFLSKYQIIFLPLAVGLFLIFSKENRHWLTKKEPYLALIIALILASPVLIWNWQHGFPSLLHHGARLGSHDYLNNILTFLLLQFIMFSPPLFFFALTLLGFHFWRELRYEDKYSKLFVACGLVPLAFFFFISPITLVGGHWTSTAYLGLIILLANRWQGLAEIKPFRWRLYANAVTIILINVLFISYYAFLYPIPAEFKGQAYTINAQLPTYIKEAKVRYVFSNQMGVASLVAFYGKTEVYMPKGQWEQFDIWGQPELKPGDNILYFVFDDQNKLAQLKPLFREVTVDGHKRLFTKDSDIPIKTQVLFCRGYRGGKLP
jgi:4-amino-4-deoxy-L-arabinose transferase-like glycosyltransferase